MLFDYTGGFVTGEKNARDVGMHGRRVYKGIGSLACTMKENKALKRKGGK